jgi:hypothetical protein
LNDGCLNLFVGQETELVEVFEGKLWPKHIPDRNSPFDTERSSSISLPPTYRPLPSNKGKRTFPEPMLFSKFEIEQMNEKLALTLPHRYYTG